MKQPLIKTTVLMLALFIFAGFFDLVFAKDYSSFCSPKTADKTFLGSLSSVSGLSFLERRIIENQITKAVKKETGVKANAKIKTFFALSPLSGSFSSLNLIAKDAFYDGVYFSTIEAKTICPYNEVLYRDNTLHLVQNSVFEYSATVTQDDLTKTITGSSRHKQIIDKMNEDAVISAILRIQNYDVKIKEDKLVFNYEIVPLPKSTGFFNHLPVKLNNFKVSFSSGLAIEDGKVQLLDFSLNNKQVSYNYLLPIVNKFNPTNWNIDLDKKKINNGNVYLDDVKIKDSKITLKGAVVVKANVN